MANKGNNTMRRVGPNATLKNNYTTNKSITNIMSSNKNLKKNRQRNSKRNG